MSMRLAFIGYGEVGQLFARELAAKPGVEAAREPSGSCESPNAADAKRTLERAEKSLHNGKYADAKRGFQSVLGCEGTSADAREGLQRVKARQEAAR